jgi:hypothetical protein
MLKIVRAVRVAAAPLALGLLLSACALGRSVIDVQAPVSTAPVSGTHFVKIAAVNDLRHFEATPSDAGTPSLENAADITNPSTTTHALARKRGSYGMALGDIVLPDNKTVADLVRGAAQKALQDKGYTVVDAASPQAATAAPLSIDINELWSWFAPGFASVTITFRSKLQLTGDDIVGSGGATVTNQVIEEPAFVPDSTWADLFAKGFTDLSNQIAAKIKPASGAAQMPPGQPSS